jgi:thiol-disulfide isomerase/thioredoxin
MNKRILMVMLALLIAVIAGASFLYNDLSGGMDMENLATQTPTEPSEPDATEPNIAAPDFTVLDREGNPVKLSDFAGKPVVLNFWASWCGPCKSEMPDFQEAWEKYDGKVVFMMVNCTDGSRETMDGALEFISEQGYTFPVYFDTTYEAAIAYGANSIPMTFFIDEGGNLIAYGQGALSAETLEKGIGMIYTPEITE